MSGHNDTVQNIARNNSDARLQRIQDRFGRWNEETNQTTFATNDPEEGLLDAYFAEQITRQFGIPDGTYTYSFGGTNDTSTADKKRRIAQIIFDRVSPQLKQNGQHTAIELIIAVLVNDNYSNTNGDSVTFEIFKTEERTSYQKISSGTLGGDSYIIVKGFALKDKEATIEIFEKEPFLLMESETPLTVIQYDSLNAEEPNESVNKTELKATFDDRGEAVVKIKFRPKVEDPDTVFDGWKEKFKPIVETTTNETGAVETSIRPQPRPDDLDTTGSSTNYTIPNTVDLLWLKVQVNGDKQKYEEEFLNESNSAYFVLSDCCSAPITLEQLKQIFTATSDADLNAMKDAFNEAFVQFSMNTCLNKAHFFAQVKQEVGNSVDVENTAENMNYRVSALISTFTSSFGRNPAKAHEYGRKPGQSANVQAIANYAYANRNGNGNFASGDGWNYRGRGFLQLTGRTNYNNANQIIQSLYPESGIDIIANPILVSTDVRVAMISAMAYWVENGLVELANAGGEDTNVNSITAVINFHTSSYASRRNHFQTTKKVFLNECS
ncbi:glycoside hydrolase family 19 protein [Aquimarina litoralis]|uniref:glycoside hydrolase family 19 protein n=1 Tax=Aquimarina litoralis TaxID=584605 RepID=UPI001C55A132|nr:glycoside hydrolase family 19 protein [Aquimarina litoralis]MBW1295647.1 hypothetical protein [Aquimarina litoralis]